jgi:hypothetical protein
MIVIVPVTSRRPFLLDDTAGIQKKMAEPIGPAGSENGGLFPP